MNSESHYVFDDESSDNEGLGRLPAQLPTVHRLVPGHEETRRKKQLIGNRKQPKNSQPRPLPRPRPIPHPVPVIDKNPVPPPTKLKLKPRKRPNTTKKATSKKKTTSVSKVQKKKKPTVKKTAGKSGDMLDGTVKIGGLEIEKKHAAAAGGATISGLLLWKLLF